MDKQEFKGFEGLIKLMSVLREKCPWDKEQTFKSLNNHTIEEAYELSDAIIEDNIPNIKEELGDLLIHIVFHSTIASEKSLFNINGIIENTISKLICGHPHIFGDSKVSTIKEIEEQWEEIKHRKGKTTLGGVPNSLPSLLKAVRIQEKASAAGLDWTKKEDCWKKVEEEILELNLEVEKNNIKNIKEEYGDLLFSLINYGRFININPHEALELSNKKFINRFNEVEKKAIQSGKNIKNHSVEELDILWKEAKNLDK